MFSNKQNTQTICVSIVTTVVALMLSVHALEAQRHQGSWYSAGIGAGVNTSGGIDDDTRKGWAGYGRFGGTIFHDLLIAAELLVWSRGWGEPDETPVDQVNTTGNISVSVLFFPSREGGLFLKVGVGAAVMNVSQFTQLLGQQTSTETGTSATLGVGFDMHLNDQWSLTWNGDLILQTFDTIVGFDVTARDASAIVFTVGLTRH